MRCEFVKCSSYSRSLDAFFARQSLLTLSASPRTSSPLSFSLTFHWLIYCEYLNCSPLNYTTSVTLHMCLHHTLYAYLSNGEFFLHFIMWITNENISSLSPSLYRFTLALIISQFHSTFHSLLSPSLLLSLQTWKDRISETSSPSSSSSSNISKRSSLPVSVSVSAIVRSTSFTRDKRLQALYTVNAAGSSGLLILVHLHLSLSLSHLRRCVHKWWYINVCTFNNALYTVFHSLMLTRTDGLFDGAHLAPLSYKYLTVVSRWQISITCDLMCIRVIVYTEKWRENRKNAKSSRKL